MSWFIVCVLFSVFHAVFYCRLLLDQWSNLKFWTKTLLDHGALGVHGVNALAPVVVGYRSKAGCAYTRTALQQQFIPPDRVLTLGTRIRVLSYQH